jgi:uncharacterized protein (DUF934 family)
MQAATRTASEGTAPKGVTLSPTDDPAQLTPYFHQLAVICVEFPEFTDGRGYSIAAVVRKLGFAGDLRAIGDVLVDQVFMLKRVGFTSFALRADQDAVAAAAALVTYSDAYQGAADQTLPYFRRRTRRDHPVETCS